MSVWQVSQCSVGVHDDQHEHGLAVVVDGGGGACDGVGLRTGGADEWVAGSVEFKSMILNSNNCNYVEQYLCTNASVV